MTNSTDDPVSPAPSPPPLIAALLRRLGLPDLQPDADGVLTLYLETDFPVFLRPGADGGSLLLHAGLGDLGDADPARVLTALLQGTTLEMGRSCLALGLVPGTGLVILIGRESFAGLDVDALMAKFDAFVAAATGWRELLRGLLVAGAQDGQGGPVGTSEPESPELSFGPSRFV
jgi:hypothetical protein